MVYVIIIMYANEIRKILDRHPATRRYFIGCFAADEIRPHYSLYPYCCVVNMDCSGWEGSHWIAIFVRSKTAVEYYDSLGNWPPISPYIVAFLQKFSDIEYNNDQIQSERSKSCGKHAIFFLCLRCSGAVARISELVSYFRKCKQNPDDVFNDNVRQLMHIQ